MTTTKQGMSFAEVEQIIAQRVANAIETIAIYETKTRMARESMNQIKQQEEKIAEDTSNKRKWEGESGTPKAIWLVGTTRDSSMEVGQYHHGFCHQTPKDAKEGTIPFAVIVVRSYLIVVLENGEVEPRDILGPFNGVKPMWEPVAYRLELPQQLSRVKARFIVEILDLIVKRLKRNCIPIIKVWNSRRGPEFTWEREDQFQKKYPHLFAKPVPSSSVAT
ncbi:hypothetical protein Tco_0665415 [Tanacetum coccineum]